MNNLTKVSLTFIISFILHVSVCTAQTKRFGNYFNKWRYWGPMFVLKSDSTFEYTERTSISSASIDTHIFSDSSYGKYTMLNDTIFLKYSTEEVNIDPHVISLRPKKLYWKGKSLYHINPINGIVLTGKENYMKWSKLRAPNLSNYSSKYLSK